jgi:hypothetical protein
LKWWGRDGGLSPVSLVLNWREVPSERLSLLDEFEANIARLIYELRQPPAL